MADEEISEELQGLNSVASDVDEHVTRLKGLHQKGKLEGNIADELVGTILPLFSEFVESCRTWASSNEEYVNELADELEEGPPGTGSALDEEDLEALRQLYSFAIFCAEGAKATAPPKAQQELTTMLEKAGAVLEKLGVEKNEPQDTEKTTDATDDETGSGEELGDEGNSGSSEAGGADNGSSEGKSGSSEGSEESGSTA